MSQPEDGTKFRCGAQRFISATVAARTDSGVPFEIYCFSKEVQWVPFEKVQSDITEHLLAVLPSFGLRVFQRSSDIHQEGRHQIDVVGGAFPSDSLSNPVRPGIGDSSVERNS